MKYRKKPIVVDADENITNEDIVLDTGHGMAVARPGDFIITDIEGVRYPCKREVFLATYELVLKAEDSTGEDMVCVTGTVYPYPTLYNIPGAKPLDYEAIWEFQRSMKWKPTDE
jgi:hypothetical protein